MSAARKRQAKLLKRLIENSNYVACSNYANDLDVSDKTIYNDIAELNKYLVKYNIIIDKSPRNGIKIVGDNLSEIYLNFLDEYDLKREYSILERQMMIMKYLFVDDKVLSYEMLSNEFLVSASSIRSDLDELQTCFQGYKAEIVSNINGTRLVGDEEAIQNVLVRFIMKIYFELRLEGESSGSKLVDVTNKLMGEDLCSKVYEAYLDLQKEGLRDISDYYMSSFLISVDVLITRILINKHIKHNNHDLITNIGYMDPYLLACKMSKKLEKLFSISFEEEDIKYLSGLMFAYGIKPKFNDLMVSSEEVDAVNKIVERMSSILNVELKYDISLFNSLAYHIRPMIYRLKEGIRIKNPLLNDIKKQYRMMQTIVWYACSILENQFNVVLNDDEVSFITIYFQVALDKIKPHRNVLIVCPIGLSTSELIYNRVKSVLSSHDYVKVVSVNDVYAYDLSDVDFIISSTRLDRIDKKVIYVSPLVTHEELSEIANYYFEINSSANITCNINPEVFNLIDYFESDLVFLEKDFKTKEEILEFIVHEYEKKNYVTNDFKNSIYERELLGYTSVNTGVALPHAMPNTVNVTKFSILTLKQEVKWDKSKVKLVIMLAVAEKDIEQVKNIFVDLYSIVENKELVNLLCTAKDKQSLLAYLVTKGGK